MSKFKTSISKGITKMNIKTANFMEKNKAQTYIKTLEQENINIYCNLGKTLYEKYLEDNIKIDEFKSEIELISQNLKVISEQKEKIRNLELEENRVLGLNMQSAILDKKNVTKIKKCPNCNFENNMEYKFCEKCGTNIE